MGFDVYPNTLDNPRLHPHEIKPESQMSDLEKEQELLSITLFTGQAYIGNSGLPYPNVMFIRVAIPASGTVAEPTIILQATNNANPSSPGNPEPIIGGAPPDDEPPTNYGTWIVDGAGTPVARGFNYGHQGNNVYLVKVVVGEMQTSWKMRIRNNDSVPHDFVWVVAGSDEESQQPWIDVSPISLTYDVLVNEKPENTVQSLTVANKGTGPLTITDTTPQLPSDFTFPVPPPIDPNSSKDIEITFNAPAAPPAPDGKTVEDFSTEFSLDKPDTTASDASEHNKFFKLTATTRALEVMLLLDVSGSMGWAPDGTFLPAGSIDSRWYEMKSAVKEFLDLLGIFGGNHGTFGIAKFPASNPAIPATYDVVSPIIIPDQGAMGPDQDAMEPHKTAVSGATPTNSTPMGDGLAHVLPLDPSYFSADSTDKNVNRRWLLLLSDGANNSGAVDPRSFIPPPPPANILVDNRIKIFAVGYGTDDAPGYSVDWSLLEDLANGSYEGGDKRRVHVENLSALNIAEAFRDAIKTNISPAITSSADPPGKLQSGAAEARHQVIITPFDTKAAFILHWCKPDEERMNLQLLTPRCELITPESASGGSGESGITFSKELRYQMYSVNHDYLRNAKDPSRPRYGTWSLIVSSDKLGRGDSESYTHDVIVESRLRMEVRPTRSIYYAGDPIGLSAVLTLNGRPVKNAAVTVCVTPPGHFAPNWLASATVSDNEYQKASKTLAGQDVTPLFIKSYAALKKGITFEPFTTSETIPMNDSSGNGIYEASVNRTSVPGGYTFYIIAIGQTKDGVMFRREREVQIGVSVRPEPEYTLFDVQYHRIPDSGPGVIGADITVWPRDRFGNVVLVDPAYNPCIEIMARGKKPEGKLVGKMDGSYSQTVRFAAGEIPTIGLKVSGREVVRELHLPPVDRLHYVDRVIDFRKGSEAEEGANKYGDPQAVLGDVTEKDRERFVSLGGFGSITVGFQGQAILASGKAEDDITVFVRRDEDLRPYAVEALAGGYKGAWVELGTSPGVTQSFSLGKARLRKATAIRITDRSGRTTDSEGKPIATPGVSIRGVGVRRVGPL